MKRIFNNYNLIDVFRLIRDKIFTYFFFGTSVRIIRNPFYIIGKKYIHFGKDFQSGPRLRIEVISNFFSKGLINENLKPSLNIGDNVSCNFNVHIGVIEKVVIGDNVLIGSNVTIVDHNHGNYSGDREDDPLTIPRDRKLVSIPITIENNVWIGNGATILPGTHIESGCVIGANTVVKGQIKKNQIIVGLPGKGIKKYNPDSKKWEKI
jgi:lipopolysaccharide O-acetyltransferase